MKREARPYYAETDIQPGTGVVQGSADSRVKAPAADGAGDFIGVYAYEANEAKSAGDYVGIALHGTVAALAGGDVRAGKFAMLAADSSGAFIEVPADGKSYQSCGMFLESGVDGNYVALFVERGCVTIPQPA